MLGIVGRKLGMTRVIQEDGLVEPVTLVVCSAGKIVQIKTAEKDGYGAVVVGFEPLKKATKAKKFKRLKEFKVDDVTKYKMGDEISVTVLNDVQKVKVTGTSKGHGFSGVIKRWNFAGGGASHGSHFHREPGSVGQRKHPGKIMRGRKLPGHFGNVTVSKHGVKVIKVDKEKGLIALKGPVPGGNNNFVTITIE